jgi:hypothetical protein
MMFGYHVWSLDECWSPIKVSKGDQKRAAQLRVIDLRSHNLKRVLNALSLSLFFPDYKQLQIKLRKYEYWYKCKERQPQRRSKLDLFQSSSPLHGTVPLFIEMSRSTTSYKITCMSSFPIHTNYKILWGYCWGLALKCFGLRARQHKEC